MHKKTLIKNSIKKFQKVEKFISSQKFSNHDNIMETSFGHAFFISERIRTIRSAQRLIFDIFQKKFKFSLLSWFCKRLRFCWKTHPDRKIWSNHYWNLSEWTQEMLSNTYHDPISCLDPIFDFSKKNFHFSFFMLFSLRATSKSSLVSSFSLQKTFFSSNFKKFSFGRMKNVRVVYFSKLISENKFSLSFWALERYFKK